MQDRANKDRIAAIQDRLEGDTRANLLRYGTLKAFAGGGMSLAGASGGGGPDTVLRRAFGGL